MSCDLKIVLLLVGRVNPELRDYVEASGVGTIFSLSWLITWYGHVLNELKNIVRLYDFFLACHPLMPLYLAAAIVVSLLVYCVNRLQYIP